MTAPSITCPGNVDVMADPGVTYATVTLQPPIYFDNCSAGINITLQWTMSPPTAGSGSGTIPVPYEFYVGTTTVTYTATDACGNPGTCIFTVTVAPNDPPDITCPGNITQNTASGLCTAAISTGFPTLISGTEPITYAWVMTGATTGSGSGPITPNPYTFNQGVTTITWTAANITGTDTCQQTITVNDEEDPTFTLPTIPNGFCVTDIFQAVFNPDGTYPDDDLTFLRPDYYTFVPPDVMLDLLNLNDNCTLPGDLIIYWEIDFGDNGGPPDLFGNGQLSGYGGSIQFPLGNNRITYTVTDLSVPGNSSTQSLILVVLPRPDIIQGF
jgi:hypothetical protein